jgi:hypothetical protein
MTDAEARVVLAYYDERAESMWLAPDKAAYNRYLFNLLSPITGQSLFPVGWPL